MGYKKPVKRFIKNLSQVSKTCCTSEYIRIIVTATNDTISTSQLHLKTSMNKIPPCNDPGV